MRLYFIILIVCIFTGSSTVSLHAGLPDSLNRRQVRHLTNFCKVWGLYKYYHPQVTQNKINWNDALIRYLPKVYKADDAASYNDVLAKLLKKAGPPDFESVKRIAEDKVSLSDFSNINFHWIEQSSLLSEKNRERLQRLTGRYEPHEHKNLSSLQQEGVSLTTNETQFLAESNEKMPRPNQRLLDLFSLWNHLYYFFPYGEEQPVEMKQLLMTYLPRVFEVLEQQKYHLHLQAFLSDIKDSQAFSYSDFVANFLGRYSVPIELSYINDTTYVKKVRKKLKEDWSIRPGHRIVSINSVPVDSLRDQIRPYLPGSHNSVVEQKVNRFLLAGEKYSSANIIFADKNGATYQVSLTRDFPVFKHKPIQPGQTVTKYLTDKVAYWNTSFMKAEKVKEAYKSVNDAEYLLIDLRHRNNKSIKSIVPYFTPEKKVIQQFHQPWPAYPGKFTRAPQESNYKMFTSTYEGKVILLINEKCSGVCEVTVNAFQQLRKDVTLVGRNTAGAFGKRYTIQLPYVPTHIHYTGQRVTFKKGQHAYPQGISPDKKVTPTVPAIRTAKDSVIQKALLHINK